MKKSFFLKINVHLAFAMTVMMSYSLTQGLFAKSLDFAACPYIANALVSPVAGDFGAAFAANDGSFTSKAGWNNGLHRRALGDVNGDGRADIVGFGNEFVFVQLGQADGKFGANIQANDGFFASNSGWTGANHVRQLGDVNGDGKADLVGFGNEKVFVQLGQADGRFGAAITASDGFFLAGNGWTNADHARRVADVNGDGRADIVGFGNDRVFLAFGQSNGTFGAPKEVNGTFFLKSSGWNNAEHIRVLADVNGDRRADIVGIGNEKVFVALGTADGNFANAIEAHGNHFTKANGFNNAFHIRILADVNGDGMADLVGFGDAVVLLALGQANGTFGTPYQSSNTFFMPASGWNIKDHFRGCADVNGDRKADLVGFGNEMGYVALGQ